ncbi:long-chain fatty acid--CoA ligase [Galbitalea soli]|uniref:Long-chain fatty acid--CoA ligase n=1 Tax=Galbitalea soli TaxID=1268042 RepID=A0A7C9PN09_9MICO|nr:long-chain fatty acid--CoA ligase [Galbitalea soli]
MPAVACGDRTLSYDQVADRSFRLVNALIHRGIEVGDRVATLAPNDLTTLEWMTGLALGGYVRTALHAMNGGEAHAGMLRSSGARVLLTTMEFYDRFRADLDSAGVEYVFVLNSTDPRLLDYETVLAGANPIDARVRVSGDDVIHLAFSSGSTGTPRASVHTHASWMAVTLDNAAMLPRVTSADVYLAAAPLTHAASTVLYLLLSRGASIQILEHFSPEEALGLIQEKRCSLTVMVPTMLQVIATHPRVSDFDLSSVRAVMYAGAPISVATARAAQAAFGDVLFQSYGQSECLPVSCLTPEDHRFGVETDESVLNSAGRPCVGASVRVVDDAGTELRAGSVGEIEVSTAGRMLGIYGDSVATAERITSDGFVRTNDIGYLDHRGLLFIVDRKNDMIISGGFNIWPVEIENALLTHPGVVEAVAVGLPHPRWGETPVAIVVVREGVEVTADELIELCRAQLGSVKKPTEVILRREPFTRNELGKLPRRLLRDHYWPERATASREVNGA